MTSSDGGRAAGSRRERASGGGQRGPSAGRGSRRGPAPDGASVRAMADAVRYVALLRGINLGRARQVGMPRLKELLEARGYADVRTHLRSGNVLLDSALPEADVAADLAGAIEDEFGFAVPVVVRTGRELAAAVAGDPFE